jgi:hypothetical protein
MSTIKKEYSTITVDSVVPHTVNDKKMNAGILNAQLRQTVTTTYPSMNIKDGGLFDMADFGGAVDGQKYTSTRVTWIDTPPNETVESLQAKIANHPNARIQAVLSNKIEDVLFENEKAAIEAGLQTLEYFADKKRVKAKDGSELPGVAQYSNFRFSVTGEADIDLRTVKSNTNSATNAQAEAVAADAMNAL